MALHATKKTLPRLRSLPLPAKINLQTTLRGEGVSGGYTWMDYGL
jgi:hypothetical protein